MARLTFNLNLAIMTRYDGFDERQSQSHAVDLTVRARYTKKRIENRGLVFFGNPNTLILDPDLPIGVLTMDGTMDGGVIGAVFEGVIN